MHADRQAGEEASDSLREIYVDEYDYQLQKGEDYTLLNPVIALTFTDFSMFEGSDECISRFRLTERKRFIEYSDDVELIFVELPKFTLTLDELVTIQDKWIFFLKNAGSMEYIPDALASDPGINQAFSFANEAAMSREELEIQFKRRDFIILQRGSLILAESKGIEKGIEIGIEQGLQQGMQQGIQQGMQQGEALALQKLLTKRFGVIAPDITARIAAASAEQIEAWFDLAIDAARPDDVFGSAAH